MNPSPTWEIFKAIAKKFQEVAPEILGKETDIVALPILHDTPAEIAQDQVKDWKKGECDLIPGKTAPELHRGRARLYRRSTTGSWRLGPLMDKVGNGGKGIAWNTAARGRQHLRELNGE